MTDFTAARINMVDSQIHPMGVVNEAILDAFRAIGRQDFVPQDRRAVAYSDEDMPIAVGRWLMEPVTHARLLQAAVPTMSDLVLDIGGGTGYSAAILSALTQKIVALEPDAMLSGQAQASWAALGQSNIVAEQGAFLSGSPESGPYNLIVVNGALSETPQVLLDQLAPHGRLVAVIKSAGDKIGRAMLFVKSSSGAISERTLFDAAVPYLPGQSPKTAFTF